MKIYAAIADAETVRMFFDKTGIKLNYLISYHYLYGQAYKLTKKYRRMIESLYLDSGAFSVSTGKSKITISEYLKYLKLYGNLFDEYFNLDDKFDDPDHNQSNQDYLKNNLPPEAKDPIPVVHDNEDPYEEFKLYVALGYQYIAIGSTTRVQDEVFDKINEEHPDVRVHMFGNLNREMLISFKPYSTDSATWAHAAGFGSILYWDPDEKKKYQIYMGSKDKKEEGHVHYKKFEHKEKLETFLDSTFQYQYSDFLGRGGVEKRQIVNLYFFKQLEDYLNEQ